MIYPSIFPNDKRNEAEEAVFEKLVKLKDKYDIFFARKFVALSNAERPEYEIDFIISLPCKAIVCLEVKGGIISYDGLSNRWFQNSNILNPGPDAQASSASHSLLKRYTEISKKMPVGWALCFPDCQIPYGTPLPPLLNVNNIIDQNQLLFFDEALDSIFNSLIQQFSTKTGSRFWEYENFKNDALRGLGFIQLLGTRFRKDEERYIQLAEKQIELFSHIIDNQKILVNGPAGSGKTIVAKTIAQELAGNDEKILFLCFNRTLGNKLSYEVGLRNNQNILVGTFHSFAKRIIEEYESSWWQTVEKGEEGFWEIEAPAKLYDIILDNKIEKYDCIIIDEGQDFKRYWFEILFKLLNPGGKKIIFLDKMQDIFNRDTEIPEQSEFLNFRLPKNCRNTRKIVDYLGKVVCEEIETDNTPEGDEVTYKLFKNEIELQTTLVSTIKDLLSSHNISNDQILIILNSEKRDSSIASLSKITSYRLKSLDNKARFESDSIHFTSIETFKGLESDIVFIIDIHKIKSEEKKKKLYTEASRAKHKLFVYGIG